MEGRVAEKGHDAEEDERVFFVFFFQREREREREIKTQIYYKETNAPTRISKALMHGTTGQALKGWLESSNIQIPNRFQFSSISIFDSIFFFFFSFQMEGI